MKKAIEIVDILTIDCELQHNSLESNDDIYWDCYNKDNWEGMIHNLNELKKLLINGETHENETKITREYGKEL